MAIAGSLELQMSANIARLAADMNQAKGLVGNAVAGMERSLSTLKSAFGALGIGIGIAAFTGFVKHTIAAQDELSKLSQKVGITVELLAGFQHAADLSGMSLEGLTKGVKTLSTQMFDAAAGTGEGIKAFKALQVSVKDSSGVLRASEDVLFDVEDRFSKMRDGAEKSAIAVKLFG